MNVKVRKWISLLCLAMAFASEEPQETTQPQETEQTPAGRIEATAEELLLADSDPLTITEAERSRVQAEILDAAATDGTIRDMVEALLPDENEQVRVIIVMDSGSVPPP